MTKKEKHNSVDKTEWYRSPYSKIAGALIGIGTIFGFGFAVGQHYQENKNILDKIELQQEYNEKLQVEREKYQKSVMDIYEKKINNLENVVNEIRKRKNEK